MEDEEEEEHDNNIYDIQMKTKAIGNNEASNTAHHKKYLFKNLNNNNKGYYLNEQHELSTIIEKELLTS